MLLLRQARAPPGAQRRDPAHAKLRVGHVEAVLAGDDVESGADIGVDAIQAHNLGLADRLLAGLDELGAEIVSPRNAAERTSIVSARIAGLDSGDVVRHLDGQGIVVSPRRDLFRFSIHLYNSVDDIDRALAAVAELVTSTR